MLKNEVLRRCEGVGRLLLRSPGDQVKMNDKNKGTRTVEVGFRVSFQCRYVEVLGLKSVQGTFSLECKGVYKTPCS